MRTLFLIVCTISLLQASGQIDVNAFSASDSLDGKSYKELYKEFKNNIKNKEITSLYAAYYLSRARLDKDTLNIARGFYLNALNEGKDTNSKFLDSIILYGKKVNNSKYLWIAYRLKAKNFFKKRAFKESLDNHVFALECAKKNNDAKKENQSKLSIGLLKERIGRNKEALQIFKECYDYSKKNIANNNYTNKDLGSYLNIGTLLSNSYRRNGLLDSSSTINIWMQQFSKKEYLKTSTNKARLIEAEIHLEKGNYSIAIDSVNKSLPILLEKSDTKNIAFSYFIRGQANENLGNRSASILDFKKMDSIFDILQDLHPDLRPGYETLVNHYKTNKDVKNQLFYIEKLIKFDSIIHTNYAYLSEAIIKKFDTPELVEEKNILKKLLNDSKTNFLIWIIVISLILLMSIFLVYKKYQKLLSQKKIEKQELEKAHKQKFDKLLQDYKSEEISNTNHPDIQKNEQKSSELDIADEVVQEILLKLNNFEEKKEFKKLNITATNLAKKFGTNQNYLGRVIKYYKEKSFRAYINDLRLDYTLDRLRNDKTFRNYTVSAIANESGYTNAEPFSKAFKAKVGIYPSEFIAKLNKQ